MDFHISLMFSRQVIMNQFYELQNTENIMQELKDNEGVQYLAFMIDITEQ